MSKHTPAPWIIQPDSVSKDLGVSDLIVGPALGEQVCRVYVDNAEEIANAHLIAAAPEMFRLLQSYVEASEHSKDPAASFDTHGVYGTPSFNAQFLDQVIEAIAKAKGEK